MNVIRNLLIAVVYRCKLVAYRYHHRYAADWISYVHVVTNHTDYNALVYILDSAVLSENNFNAMTM